MRGTDWGKGGGLLPRWAQPLSPFPSVSNLKWRGTPYCLGLLLLVWGVLVSISVPLSSLTVSKSVCNPPHQGPLPSGGERALCCYGLERTGEAWDGDNGSSEWIRADGRQ